MESGGSSYRVGPFHSRLLAASPLECEEPHRAQPRAGARQVQRLLQLHRHYAGLVLEGPRRGLSGLRFSPDSPALPRAFHSETQENSIFSVKKPLFPVPAHGHVCGRENPLEAGSGTQDGAPGGRLPPSDPSLPWHPVPGVGGLRTSPWTLLARPPKLSSDTRGEGRPVLCSPQTVPRLLLT